MLPAIPQCLERWLTCHWYWIGTEIPLHHIALGWQLKMWQNLNPVFKNTNLWSVKKVEDNIQWRAMQMPFVKPNSASIVVYGMRGTVMAAFKSLRREPFCWSINFMIVYITVYSVAVWPAALLELWPEHHIGAACKHRHCHKHLTWPAFHTSWCFFHWSTTTFRLEIEVNKIDHLGTMHLCECWPIEPTHYLFQTKWTPFLQNIPP